MPLPISFAAAALLLAAAPAAGAGVVDGELDYERDVRPLLEARCLTCHGAERQRAGLRLDSRAGALAGGRSGLAAVLPGDGAASALYARVASADPDERMPPEGEPLDARELELLRRWIDAGASYGAGEDGLSAAIEPHWAYVAPRRPAPPTLADEALVRGPIDAFVQARLAAEGLAPAPRAARETLLRRAALDLTGLPPTLEQLERWLADDAPEALERAVDELLASPAYAEHQARWWLDLARYADTNGYEKDDRRTMWPWRDWVIAAFAADMPFDRFTLEQLAGDLLPDATPEQRLATGFHRNTMVNREGGADPEEFRVAAVVDRVNTTASVWLGSTLACAQCHDHEYDPFSQVEYYRLFAYFDGTADLGNALEPTLEWPTAGEPARVPVMQELETPRETRVHARGSFLSQGERVTPGVPAALHPLPEGAPPNRLGLARWLVDDANPLTARVLANRVWERLFGRGLVETSEDFGTQGEPPTHPELLDWLALELIEDGWSLKRLYRTLLASHTWQQSCAATPELLVRDPQNLLLARAPRLRLEAEVLRDLALAASGLLAPEVGGPSVFPPQPEGTWSATYSDDRWETARDAGRWRRGLYTFWRRTAPYPTFQLFDAPSRELACLRRPRTNTPLQALATLNDPAFVEAAGALARRMLREAQGDEARVERGFRLCTARRPDAEERALLLELLADERARYAAEPQAARALAEGEGLLPLEDHAPAELAAWTVVANVLLNLDETITRG